MLVVFIFYGKHTICITVFLNPVNLQPYAIIEEF